MSMFLLTSCIERKERIDHTDDKYIYVWQYDGDDSTLVKYSQPIYREVTVIGGHHKHHHLLIKENDGRILHLSLPYDGSVDRCGTVSRAIENRRKEMKAVLFEEFYPYHTLTFIKYAE